MTKKKNTKKLTVKEIEKKLKDPNLTPKQKDKLVADYMNSIDYKRKK